MEEKIIKCKDCGISFPLSVKRQEWYLAKGWTLPKRCAVCREERRKEKRIISINANYSFYASLMQSSITMKRYTKHHTDDFRGYMSNRKTIVF